MSKSIGDPEILRSIVFALSALPQHEVEHLDVMSEEGVEYGANAPLLIVDKTPYIYHIYVPQEEDEAKLLVVELGERGLITLALMVVLARGHRCEYIMIDSNGPEYDDFPPNGNQGGTK